MTIGVKRFWGRIIPKIQSGLWVVGVLVLLARSSALAAEPVMLKTMTFNPASRQLLLLTEPAAQLTVEKTRFSRSGQVIQFELPGVKLLPATTSTLMVTDSQTLQKVMLSAASRSGIPGVRVEVRVTPEGAFQPFSMVPEPRGLKLSWQSADSPAAAPDAVVQTWDLTVPVAPAVQPRKNEASKKQSEAVVAPHNPAVSEATSQSPARVAAVKSESIKTPKVSKSSETTKAQSSTQLPAGFQNSILGPVSPLQTSLITDIYSEGRQVSVIGQGLPLSVKKSFALMAPGRFIVDISPAVMASTRPLRRILSDEPGVELIKTSQFDESTVRCVIQFTNTTPPLVEVKTDSLKNRLMLTF